VHFLLGPATVALAVPLYAQLGKLKHAFWPICGALLAGAVTALVSAVGIAWALGATDLTLLSIAPKSVTTPIAMGIVERLGGLPSFTAVLVVTTGIVGAGGPRSTCSTPCASATTASAASRSARPRTASAPRAHFRKAMKRARSPGSPWSLRTRDGDTLPVRRVARSRPPVSVASCRNRSPACLQHLDRAVCSPLGMIGQTEQPAPRCHSSLVFSASPSRGRRTGRQQTGNPGRVAAATRPASARA